MNVDAVQDQGDHGGVAPRRAPANSGKASMELQSILRVPDLSGGEVHETRSVTSSVAGESLPDSTPDKAEAETAAAPSTNSMPARLKAVTGKAKNAAGALVKSVPPEWNSRLKVLGAIAAAIVVCVVITRVMKREPLTDPAPQQVVQQDISDLDPTTAAQAQPLTDPSVTPMVAADDREAPSAASTEFTNSPYATPYATPGAGQDSLANGSTDPMADHATHPPTAVARVPDHPAPNSQPQMGAPYGDRAAGSANYAVPANSLQNPRGTLAQNPSVDTFRQPNPHVPPAAGPTGPLAAHAPQDVRAHMQQPPGSGAPMANSANAGGYGYPMDNGQNQTANPPAYAGGGYGVPQGAMPQNAGPQNAGPQNAMPQNAMPQNAMPQNAMPQNAMPQNAMPQNAMPQNAGPQNAGPQNAGPDGVDRYSRWSQVQGSPAGPNPRRPVAPTLNGPGNSTSAPNGSQLAPAGPTTSAPNYPPTDPQTYMYAPGGFQQLRESLLRDGSQMGGGALAGPGAQPGQVSEQRGPYMDSRSSGQREAAVPSERGVYR